MLNLSSLGKWIEERLNAELNTYITNNTNTILKTNRSKYAFTVYTDQGKHKAFDYLDTSGNITQERTNSILRYIECQLSQNDSTVEATGYVSVTRDTVLELLIPLDSIDEVGYEATITEEIRTVLDNTFKEIGDASIVEDGITYDFGYKYSLSNTGIRVNRPFIGDSLSMTAYINFFYVQDGINANDIHILIDGVDVVLLRYGFNRGTTQQSNVFSGDSTMTAKNTPTSSLFSFNFDTTARRTTPLFDAIMFGLDGVSEGYVKTGNGNTNSAFTKSNYPNTAHLVSFVVEGHIGTIHKLMIFENVAVSGAIPLLASLSVTMTEVKLIDGLTPLSKAATEYYYGIAVE